jgi:hypothetical protein
MRTSYLTRLTFAFIGIASYLLCLESYAYPQNNNNSNSYYTDRNKSRNYLKAGDVGYLKEVSGPPSDFPLPVPPGAHIISARETTANANRRGFYLSYTIDGDALSMNAWYKQSLIAGGWKLGTQISTPVNSIVVTSFTAIKQGISAQLSFSPQIAPKKGSTVIITVNGW